MKNAISFNLPPFWLAYRAHYSHLGCLWRMCSGNVWFLSRSHVIWKMAYNAGVVWRKDLLYLAPRLFWSGDRVSLFLPTHPNLFRPMKTRSLLGALKYTCATWERDGHWKWHCNAGTNFPSRETCQWKELRGEVKINFLIEPRNSLSQFLVLRTF